MKKALVYIGISSSLVTFLINLLPDSEIGLKTLLFMLFGVMAFGLSWFLSKIKSFISGVITGIIVGIFTGFCITSIDNSLTRMTEFSGTLNYNFLLSLKWIIPIAINTLFGVDPWKKKPLL